MAQPAELTNPPPSGDTIAAWLADVPKWVAYDLALIKKDDETTDKLVHYSRKIANSSLKCFKVQGTMKCTPADLEDLLCKHLLERQHEWHELFIRGQLLEQNKEANVWVWKMLYRVNSAFVANRWCQYLLKYTPLDDGFILTYRSVLHKDCPPEKGAERTDILIGSHCCQDLKDGTCLLTSLQQATPGGWVPNVLSNMMQVDIILGEIRKTKQVQGEQKNIASCDNVLAPGLMLCWD